jgi:hypothetical protein
MAGTTKRRARRAAKRVERQRRAAIATRSPLKQKRGPGYPDLPPPEWPDDLDGGAGVREPRRPFPHHPAGALELEPSRFDNLELIATPLR